MLTKVITSITVDLCLRNSQTATQVWQLFETIYGGGSEIDRPAQSLEPPCRQASRLQRCSGSAAMEQDLCKTVTETSEVNWAMTLDGVPKQVWQLFETIYGGGPEIRRLTP